MNRSSVPDSAGSRTREPAPPNRPGLPSWWRRSWLRLAAVAAILALCTAGLTSAAPAAGTAAGTASEAAALPTPRTASLYVSDYTDNNVLKRRTDRWPADDRAHHRSDPPHRIWRSTPPATSMSPTPSTTGW